MSWLSISIGWFVDFFVSSGAGQGFAMSVSFYYLAMCLFLLPFLFLFFGGPFSALCV
jgi:hypothetical protein